jgi:Ni/Co efflux regulator RcnB
MRPNRLVLALIVATALAPPAHAKKARDPEPEASGDHVAAIVFDEVERRVIRDFFADPSRRQAVAARPLPPGIAKKVARGGRLPPGIAKRYLPDDLDRRLRPLPAGTQRMVVGDDVLLVEAATGLVYDIVRNALSGH